MRSGYAIDAATNGREAMELFEANDYDAILLDLFMPFMHGSTVVSLIGQKRPDMLRRVIVVSGARDEVLEPLFANTGAILHKPITVEILRSVVREVTKPVAEDDIGTMKL